MKAGIVGAGALGSLFAHHFQEQLIEFVIYEKNTDVTEKIRNNGISLIKGETSRIIKPAISSTPDILTDTDIVFLFVKSYSTAEAVKDISNYLNKDSIVVSLQNGLGNIEEIKKIIPADQIVYGSTTIGAAKSSPSEVISGGSGVINIGGSVSGHVQKVHHLLNNAGMNSYTVEDPDYYLWHKAVINAGINPIASILGITNGAILTNNFASKLQENIVMEGVNSANAEKINLDYKEMLKITRDVCKNTSSNRCSMLQDLQNGRRTEIESINGKIIEYAEKNRIELPFNRSLYLLIKSMETITR